MSRQFKNFSRKYKNSLTVLGADSKIAEDLYDSSKENLLLLSKGFSAFDDEFNREKEVVKLLKSIQAFSQYLWDSAKTVEDINCFR